MLKLSRPIVCAALCTLAAAGSAQATVITFNGSVTSGTSVSHGANYAGYTESGFTLGSTGNAVWYEKDQTEWGGTYSADGTDFAFYEGPANAGGFISSATPFSIQSLQLAGFFGSANPLTFTGTLSGGGTVTTAYNTPGGDKWSTFSFDSSWTGLTRVDIQAAGTLHVGLDNIHVNEAVSAVPEPATWTLMLGALPLLGLARRRRSGN